MNALRLAKAARNGVRVAKASTVAKSEVKAVLYTAPRVPATYIQAAMRTRVDFASVLQDAS